MARKLFGTDGIRGFAGEAPLDVRTAFALGVALGEWAVALQGGEAGAEPEVILGPEVIIGMDTRESGPWLARSVAGGLRRAGVVPRFAGVVTTPGVAYLARSGPFAAGVMISASHNPYQDNGIKVFAHTGFKLPDEEEEIIEREILRLRQSGVVPHSVKLEADDEWAEKYL